MKTELIDIQDLSPFEKNPREISSYAIEKVRNSIKEHGFNQPLVIEEGTNRICVGHTRYLAAKDLGLKKVPCFVKKFKSEEHFLSYNLADNKTNELSEWNDHALLPILNILKDSDDKDNTNYLNSTSFSEKELDELLGTFAVPNLEDDYDYEKRNEGMEDTESFVGEDFIKVIQLYLRYKHYKEYESLVKKIREKLPEIKSNAEVSLEGLRTLAKSIGIAKENN